MSDIEPQIYDFLDYREYLLATVEFRKRLDPNYSRKTFAQAIGFSSDSGLNMVLSRKRDLRAPYLDQCISELKLDTAQRVYFEALVRAGRMSDVHRAELLNHLKSLNPIWPSPALDEGMRLIDFFIVQQILILKTEPLRPEQIRELFRYPITRDEVEDILLWMADNGFVDTENGRYRAKVDRTGDERMPTSSIENVHSDALGLARQALLADPEHRREFQTFFFTICQNQVEELKETLKSAMFDVLQSYTTETQSENQTVMQLHFHLVEVIKNMEAGMEPVAATT